MYSDERRSVLDIAAQVFFASMVPACVKIINKTHSHAMPCHPIESSETVTHKWKTATTIWLSFGTATVKWFHIAHFSQAFIFHAPKKTTNLTLVRSTISTHIVHGTRNVEQSFWNIGWDQTRANYIQTFPYRATSTFVPVRAFSFFFLNCEIVKLKRILLEFWLTQPKV